MPMFFAGWLLVGMLWAAPADAQFGDFYDNMNDLDSWSDLGPTYEPPSSQVYPSWSPDTSFIEEDERAWQAQERAREMRQHQQYMRGLADEQNWVDQMRGNRCSGNWGVQTWNECD